MLPAPRVYSDCYTEPRGRLQFPTLKACRDLYHTFSSVAQSCPILCDPMGCSKPGFPVHGQSPELAQTHVHPCRWCHPTVSSSVVPFSSRLQSCLGSGSFPMFFTSGGQSIGVSASTSVFPMNIQDRFPLGWTGWISLQSKGLSRVFSNTTVQKHQFFGAQLSHPYMIIGKTALTRGTFVGTPQLVHLVTNTTKRK